jgi:hypothetical protein
MRIPILLSALALATLTLLPLANAAPVNADCGNYGNLVNVGSSYACHGKGGCANYGVIANVGSTFDCGGTCTNSGVVANVASKYCGSSQTLQVCLGSTCIGSDQAKQATPAAVKVGDCVPQAEIGDFTTLHITCGGPDGCGAVGSPVCWTVRYACMNALVAVLRVYDTIRHNPESSDCQGQPGWPAANPTPIGDCSVNFGNCTGGCHYNIGGVCGQGGSCTLNLGGVCSAQCTVNVVNVCSQRCTIAAVGVCRTHILDLTTWHPGH